MIRNDNEYQEAVRRLREEQERLAEHRKRLEGMGLAADEVERALDPPRCQFGASNRNFVVPGGYIAMSQKLTAVVERRRERIAARLEAIFPAALGSARCRAAITDRWSAVCWYCPVPRLGGDVGVVAKR
jgi:hypothetical protein